MNEFQILEDMLKSKDENNGGRIALIRHAHRLDLPPDERQKNISITPQGECIAKILGNNIPIDTSLILSHSGLIRTQKTAECINLGFKQKGGFTRKLFAIQSQYGTYVHSNQIYQWGWRTDFLTQWMKGYISPEIIDPPQKAVYKILGMLLDNQKSNCYNPSSHEIYLHVGHDWDIIALQYVGLNLSPEKHSVGFLEGIIMERKDTTLRMWRNGHCSSLKLQDFGLNFIGKER